MSECPTSSPRPRTEDAMWRRSRAASPEGQEGSCSENVCTIQPPRSQEHAQLVVIRHVEGPSRGAAPVDGPVGLRATLERSPEQGLAELCHDHVDRDFIGGTDGHDHVRVSF
jgi:hypothetical protein